MYSPANTIIFSCTSMDFHPTSFFILENVQLGTFWVGQANMVLDECGFSLLPAVTQDELLQKLETICIDYAFPSLDLVSINKNGSLPFYGVERWISKLRYKINKEPKKYKELQKLLTAGWHQDDYTDNSTLNVLHVKNERDLKELYKKLIKDWETKGMRCLNAHACKTRAEKYQDKKKDPDFLKAISRKKVLRQMENTKKLPKPETLAKYEIQQEEIKERVGSTGTGIVYKLTCPEGKSYVGRTIQSFKKRMDAHVYGKGYCRALKEAINKHGFNRFEKEIIWEGEKDVVAEKEAYFIQHFNTMYPNGYNLSTGGGRGEHRSADTIQHMIKNQRELAKQRNNGLLGYIIENKSSWTVNSHRCWIGNFKTKEEALSCQLDYTQDPDKYHNMYSKQRATNGDGGVYYRKDRNKWTVMPCINGKNVYMGSYETREEACEVLTKAFL